MKANKNVWVIPTDKPSRLANKDSNNKLEVSEKNTLFVNGFGFTPQNLYITSDEALPYDDSIFDNGAFYHRDAVGDVHIITKHTFKPNPHFCKRIILTTDQDLIKDGVQAIDDEFLEWFVKNPSCEEVFIEKVGGKYFSDRTIGVISYEIIIPKEEICSFCDGTGQVVSSTTISRFKTCDCKIIPKEETKEETLEEVAERLYSDKEYPMYGEIRRDGFINGAKWMQERSYSEEEVIAFGEFIFKHSLLTHTRGVKSLFEQFKK